MLEPSHCILRTFANVEGNRSVRRSDLIDSPLAEPRMRLTVGQAGVATLGHFRARMRRTSLALARPDMRSRTTVMISCGDQRRLLLCVSRYRARHADYLGSWLEVPKEASRSMIRAASQASRQPITFSDFPRRKKNPTPLIPSQGGRLLASCASPQSENTAPACLALPIGGPQ
jgi:hypothetical protein